MDLPFWQPVVQFDIDFVMKCWLIKYLSVCLLRALVVRCGSGGRTIS